MVVWVFKVRVGVNPEILGKDNAMDNVSLVAVITHLCQQS